MIEESKEFDPTSISYANAVKAVAYYKATFAELIEDIDIEVDRSVQIIQLERDRLDAIDIVLKTINEVHNIFNKNRQFEVITKRQAVQYWLRKNTNYTTAKVGQMTCVGGKFDHSTICNSMRMIEFYKESRDYHALALCRQMWNILDEHKKVNYKSKP